MHRVENKSKEEIAKIGRKIGEQDWLLTHIEGEASTQLPSPFLRTGCHKPSLYL